MAARLCPALFVALALAGCAHRAPTPTPLAEAAPEAAPPRPVLPPTLATVTPPPLDSSGHYRTINSNLNAAQTVWHVRAALNVAAIGCRGPDDAGLTPAYNTMLKTQKAVLADANRQVQAGFRATGSAGWQAASDAEMTRLYNFFAMPAAKVEFCEVAGAVAPRAAAIAPDAFAPFAAQVLPQLEAPFTAVFAQIDRYKVEVAEWDARYASGTRLAAAAPALVALADPAPAARVAAAPVQAATPTLAYADLGAMVAWEPQSGRALAMR